jgi:hypothetical protein
MVTVISKPDKFVFTHIPKCGGMSIRIGLEEAIMGTSEAVWHYGTIRQHPDAGRFMPAHKPLRMLKRHFSDELDSYLSSNCYAVVREPRARFASAVQQHTREFLGKNLGELSISEVKNVVDLIVENIVRDPVFAGVEYIHFTRQIDYVDLEGRRVVQNIFPIEHLDSMALAMSVHLGRKVAFSKMDNVSSGPPSLPLRVLSCIGKSIKSVTPDTVYKSGKRFLMSRLSGDIDPRIAEFLRGYYVTSFVDDFYSEDAKLHSEVLKREQDFLVSIADTGLRRNI